MKEITFQAKRYTISAYVRDFLRVNWQKKNVFFPMMIIGFLIFVNEGFAQTYKDEIRQVKNLDYVSSQDPLDLVWINSNLQANNSAYSEGMSTLQRIIFENLPPAVANEHKLRIRIQTLKGGKHAYDFITSWEQSMNVAQTILPPGFISLPDPGSDVSHPVYTYTEYDDLACGPNITSTAEIACVAADVSGNEQYLPVVQDEIPNPNVDSALDSSTRAAIISAYESVYGDRTVKVKGDLPFTGTAGDPNSRVTFAGFDGEYMFYDISWVSASSSIVIEFGAQIAAGFSPTGVYSKNIDYVVPADGIVGYGPGRGASNVSGAPYHVKFTAFLTEFVDGKAPTLGSQDNQLMAEGVRLIPFCNLEGQENLCLDDIDGAITYNGNARNLDGPSYSWSFKPDSNTSNASFSGATDGPTVDVNPGDQAGSYTLIFRVTNSSGLYDECEITTTIGEVTIDDEEICLSVGESAGSVTLNYSGTPAGTTPFVSDDTSVATVTASGEVTAVGAGTADITYTDENGCQAVATITVNANPTIDDEEICLSVGESAGSVTLNYSGTPAGTTPFVSDDTSVATVTASGEVTAVGAGTADITYTDENGCQAVATITVNANPTIDDEEICLSVGESAGSVTLNYSGTPAGTTPFVSDDTSVATVTASGEVTAVGAGTADITYTDENGCQAVATITVNANPTIDDEEICLSVGESAGSVTLNYSGTPAGTTPFVSDDTSVATVTASGEVTAVGAGTADITYTDENGCQAVATITVNANPTIDGEEICLSVGESAGSVTLNYSGTPAGTTPFVSDDTSVATVTASGEVTAVGAGTADITYTDENGCQAVATITVNANPTIDDEEICLSVGESAGSVTLNYSGTPAGTTPFVSDDTSVATVTASGEVTAVGAGTADITYTDENGCQAVATITVNANPTIDDEEICLSVGESAGSVTLNYSGTPAGTTPFVSDDTSVATVTASGEVTAVGAGTADITYTDENGCQAVATITVNPLPILETDEPQLTCFGEKPSIAVTSSKDGLEFKLEEKGLADGTFADYTGPFTDLKYETDYVLTARDKTTGCETEYEFKTDIQIDIPAIVQLTVNSPTCGSYDGSTYFGSIQIDNHVPGYLYAVVDQATFVDIESVPVSAYMNYDGTSGLISGVAVGEYYVIAKSPDGCVSAIAPAILLTPDCLTCETAFAKDSDRADGKDSSYCFIYDNVPNYENSLTEERWGWTNEYTQAEYTTWTESDPLVLDLYAAAGQCDILKGALAGYVEVYFVPNGKAPGAGTFVVEYISNETELGWLIEGAQFYIGEDPYPKNGKGKNAGEYTVAPGKYPFTIDTDATNHIMLDALECDGVEKIYIIAHAEVCTANSTAYQDKLWDEAQTEYFNINIKNNSIIYAEPTKGGKTQVSTSTTSLSESSEPIFSIAPVPFKDVLNIGYLFDYTSDVTIQVFDLNGRLLTTYKDTAVNSDSISTFNVDFRTKSNQIYIVRMTTDREVYSAKIISAK